MKEYISSLYGRIPTIDDFADGPVFDPDKSSKEEYADFCRLVASWENDLMASISYNKDYKQYGALLKSKTSSTTSLRVGGDQMVTGWLPHLRAGKKKDYRDYLNRAIPEIEPALLAKFIEAKYTSGNIIFWKRHRESVNTERGKAPILDRIDLTLESLKRWYAKESGGAQESVELLPQFNEDRDYFIEIFGSFKSFVSCFKLEPFLTGESIIDLEYSNLDSEYGERNVLPVTEGRFSDKLPENYERYLRNAIVLIEKRTKALAPIFES